MVRALPRYTIRNMKTGERLAYRVSHNRYALLSDDAMLERGPKITVIKCLPPRFRIKIDLQHTYPFILADASRPAFRGRYASLDAALRAMDTKVALEKGIGFTTERPRAFDEHTPTEDEHVGQHLQGCVSCYAHTEKSES